MQKLEKYIIKCDFVYDGRIKNSKSKDGKTFRTQNCVCAMSIRRKEKNNNSKINKLILLFVHLFLRFIHFFSLGFSRR